MFEFSIYGTMCLIYIRRSERMYSTVIEIKKDVSDSQLTELKNIIEKAYVKFIVNLHSKLEILKNRLD